ncbi:hypothetical protein D3Y59_17390 [Hymenobacter oligotrophus]|uniref:Uncharacterized protein n=1 Tax=Hymenobacter oligotrophus TaxID=2319843 RepID=A0A3B7RW44_9BACT|nr:hypothetical protein [Hymenobacter oligotrophus]AYA38667.1 hypothetical protein D3Y59_17390 [Hymenobacter oligotrophus]
MIALLVRGVQLAPMAMWWGLGMAVVAALNLLGQEELWPHTPAAAMACQAMLAAGVGCVVASAPVAAWRWAAVLPGQVLPALARLVAIAGAIVAVPVLIFLVVSVVWAAGEAITRY